MPETIMKDKINYDFIDSLRFIAIITIVIEHSYFWPSYQYFKNIDEQIIQTITMELFKFGTITFYILAGFLIGDKIHTTTSLQYLKRRFDGTFKPWLFWIIVFLILIYANALIIFIKGGDAPAFENPLMYFWEKIKYIIVDTSFWFILNFLGSISILLLFRRYLYSKWVGLLLGTCSIFYSVDIYYHWIPSGHTTAILGFVFYLWIGVILHKYFSQFNEWIKLIKLWHLILLSAITFSLSCFESLYIMNNHIHADPYNTLKITNIIYSLAVFLLLYKIGNPRWIKNLNPRSSTYGIHLVHYIIIVQILPTIFNPLGITPAGKSSIELVIIQYIRFFIAYFASYFLVYLINKSNRIKWIVGQ
ncbi:acyltransferase [Pedobacter aquatilis]|uniref:acyltransferase n=1 Tax=Pedobacter aquatilis TaxID=351343 RepID=UPI00292FE7C2|nr:acyltransferase [Pedobacter aquatilis]